MTQNTFLNTGSSSSSSSTFSFGASSSSSSSSSSSTSGDRESKRGPITDMSKLQRSQLQAELDKELTSEETSKAAHNERYARIRALAEAKRSQEAASASSSAASPSPLSPAAASGRSRASTGRYVTLQGAQGGVGSSQSGNTLSPAEGSSLPRRASAPNALSNPVVPSIFRRERASPERYVDVTWQGGVESPQSASALSPAAGSSQPRRGSAPNTLNSSVAPSVFRRERASPERYMGITWQGGVESPQSTSALSPAAGSSQTRRGSAPNTLSSSVAPSVFRRERASPERYMGITWQGGVESPQSASALSPAAGSSQPRRGSAPNASHGGVGSPTGVAQASASSSAAPRSEQSSAAQSNEIYGAEARSVAQAPSASSSATGGHRHASKESYLTYTAAKAKETQARKASSTIRDLPPSEDN